MEHFSVVLTGEGILICNISACKSRGSKTNDFSVNGKVLLLWAFALSHLPELTSSKRVVKIPWLVAEDQCSPCCQMGVWSGVVVGLKWKLLLLFGALGPILNNQCKRGSSYQPH